MSGQPRTYIAFLIILTVIISAGSAIPAVNRAPQPTASQITPSSKQNYKHLVNAQSLNGYTGNIYNPSPHTTPEKNFTFGLHRFNVGVNYGIAPDWEGGMSLDLKGFTHWTSTAVALHTKYHLLKQYAAGQEYPQNYFDYSVGIRNTNLYFVFGKKFENFFDAVVESGVDVFMSEDKKFGYFLTLAKPTKYSYFLFDYKSYTGQINIGWRVLLSRDVKLDLFLIKIERIRNVFDNFVFGLTLAG